MFFMALLLGAKKSNNAKKVGEFISVVVAKYAKALITERKLSLINDDAQSIAPRDRLQWKIYIFQNCKTAKAIGKHLFTKLGHKIFT